MLRLPKKNTEVSLHFMVHHGLRSLAMATHARFRFLSCRLESLALRTTRMWPEQCIGSGVIGIMWAAYSLLDDPLPVHVCGGFLK